MKNIMQITFYFLLLFLVLPEILGNETGSSAPVFPIPQQAEYLEEYFRLSESTVVLLPEKPGEQDRFLAHLLVSELAERYDLVLDIKHVTDLSGMDNFILMGSVANPLIREYASENNIPVNASSPGPEGYFLQVSGKGAAVMGSNEPGAFYGLQSLRQLINRQSGERIMYASIKDWPHMPFRGIHVYMPGPENLAFFKRFIRDFMAYFKLNKMILEVNAGMRFENHPEMNAGAIQFHKDLVYTRRRSVKGPNGEEMVSTHDRVADGKVLDRDQVADLVAYARKFQIEVIPEIPSLTHSFYLLTRHRELAEIQEAEWPDTYCPLNPESYELYFDVLDEYIGIIQPETVHIGHDEWRVAADVCDRCRGKAYSELFIQDVIKIHDYLTARGIRVAMWGDHLLETHAGPGMPERYVEETGYTYRKPGALTPEQVRKYIPKDILILNWSWKTLDNRPGLQNTKNFQDWGFEQVLGNFNAEILDFGRRSLGKGLIGGQASAWCRTSESDMGPNRTQRFAASANHLWSTHYPTQEGYARIIQEHVPQIREYLTGTRPPSRDRNPVQPLDISHCFNTLNSGNPHGFPLELLQSASLESNGVRFDLAGPGGHKDHLCAAVVETARQSEKKPSLTGIKIEISLDATSLIFLHAAAHRAGCEELLGWYRIVYEDGFELLVPIQYGVNIREWHLWGTDPRTGQPDPCFTGEPPHCTTRAIFCGNICYGADLVNCSGKPGQELNFFAYEWTNPRLGTRISEVWLEGVNIGEESTADVIDRRKWKKELYLGDQAQWDASGEMIEDNAIALIGISGVTTRDINSSRAK